MHPRPAAGTAASCLAPLCHFWDAQVLFQATPTNFFTASKPARKGCSAWVIILFSCLFFSLSHPSQSLGTTCGSPTLPSDGSTRCVWGLAPWACLGEASALPQGCSSPGFMCDIPPGASSPWALIRSSSLQRSRREQEKENQNSGFCKMHRACTGLFSVAAGGYQHCFTSYF